MFHLSIKHDTHAQDATHIQDEKRMKLEIGGCSRYRGLWIENKHKLVY